MVVMISLHAAPVMMALLPAIKSGIYPVSGNGPHFCLLVLCLRCLSIVHKGMVNLNGFSHPSLHID